MTEEVKRLRAEAEQWVKDHGPSGLFGPCPSRSCWNCNPAHEHLKQADYPIDCFECGHIYFRGVRLTEDAPQEAVEEKQASTQHRQPKIADNRGM